MDIGSILVKLGLDNSKFKKGLNESQQQSNKFAGTMGKLGGIMAAAFSIDAIVAFGKEITGLAAKTEGVKQAFDKLNMPGLMTRLKVATRGTTDELKLMQSAVNAKNFKINLEQLPKLLDFATSRAMETGQSVDYLVESLVIGIGRKSPLILDNLGLNVAEVREEFAKTGDMAIAVGAIIDREMAANGRAADTAATKMQTLSASWQDFKATLGKTLAPATGSASSWLSSALDTVNKALKNESIPLWLRLTEVVKGNVTAIRGWAAEYEAQQAKNIAVDEQASKKKVEFAEEAKSLSNEVLSKEKKASQELLATNKHLQDSQKVYHLAKIRAYDDELKKRVDIANKEAEIKAAREEDAKKAREAAAKKAAEQAAELAAARAIYESQNKSIAAIQTIIKYNNERIDQAQSDEVRAAYTRENKELEWQMWLLKKTKAERQAMAELNNQITPIAGKDLSVGTSAGQFEGKPKEDITFGSTSDLDAAVAKNWEAVENYRSQKDEIINISEEMAAVLANTAVNSFQMLADSIAGVSDMNAGQAVASLLTPIADMAISAGTIIMSTGAAIDALKASLVSFFGGSAIAAGAALVGVGVAAKAGLKALASGGGSKPKGTTVSGGSVVTDNQRSAKQPIDVNVNVKGKVVGRDIQLVNDRQNRYNSKGF